MATSIRELLDAVQAEKELELNPNAAYYLYNRHVRICGRCEETLRLDTYDKKHPDKWQHTHNGGIWCKNDKQHGPKTRMAFPLPCLLMIEELDL